MNARISQDALDRDICVHIFTASAAMVGVCLTVVGLLHVVITLHKADAIGSGLLSINAILYLFACLLSYWALRTRNLHRNHRLEQIADGLFLAALTFTTVNAALITWAVSKI